MSPFTDSLVTAVDAEPLNPTYLSNRAAAYMGANKFEPALADSIRANELDAGNPKIIIRLARIYTSLGRPKEALSTYALIPGGASEKDTFQARQMAQALDAAESAIKSGKGGGQKALWDMDQAANYLGSSVSRPRKWQLLRAEAFLMNGDANALGEVQAITTSLMRDNPTDAEALVLRGRAFYQAGENDQAIKHFRQALSFDPDLSQARTLLKTVQRLAKAKEAGNAAFNAKRFSEAVKLYTEALEVDATNKGTNAKLYQNRATARIKIKEYDEAVSDCDQALKLDPSYIKARRTRAKALGESGDWTQAIKELKEIAEQYPDEPNIKKDVRNAEMELKKSTRKDYYKILGVEKDATENEINKAYKKLSIKYHPDKNPNDPSAEDKFKDLGEAKECLLDPQKRERYDSGADLVDPSEMFSHGGGMPFGGMGGGVQIDPEMLFNMMGGMGGGGRAGGMPHFQFSTGPGGRGGFPF
jgi:DnaJ family protein C protein 7